MKLSRHCLLIAITTTAIIAPCVAQDSTQSGQVSPAVSGTGQTNHIAVWKNSTTLGSSGIVATGGNVGIGTAAPAAKLEVNGNAQVDGDLSFSGVISFQGTPSLAFPGGVNAANTALGNGALPASATGTYNTAVGSESLSNNTTGYSNTAIGKQTLWANTTGANNAALGTYALSFNTSGSNNTATGFEALGTNTTGGFNTATGITALASNTLGNENTASGASAIGSNSIGSENAGFGSAALLSNVTGSFNTAVGASALISNIKGENNIAIGYLSGIEITGSNNIHIGNEGSVTDNAVIRVGCTNTNSISCPISGAAQTSTFIAGIYGAATGLQGVPVVVDANGQLGTVQSSRRYKEDIQDMADASSRLMRLRPVTFRYKKAYEDGSKPVQYGLIAEEVGEIYPDLVAHSADGQIESVRYQLLDPMLLNELQKQHATITAQQEQIRSLEERLVKIEATLSGTTLLASAH